MNGPPTTPPVSADRTVLVGVTGGIAIYKAVELVRGLVKDGLQPLVVTTEAAQRFVMPLTFAAVSQAPVLDDQSAWQASGGWFQHIEAARTARVMPRWRSPAPVTMAPYRCISAKSRSQIHALRGPAKSQPLASVEK